MPDMLRIMIIDDEPIVGKRLKRLLEKADYIVETFTDGLMAIKELEKEYFDIVITDLKMEHCDGMKVLEAARNENPDAKVIIITGFGKMETATEALNKGAFDFIIKPFKIEEIKQVILKAETELRKIKN
ncbi:MAG: response regulator [Nitrospirae bacterium]|nr:response regulator [Nitrospirota bacterium]